MMIMLMMMMVMMMVVVMMMMMAMMMSGPLKNSRRAVPCEFEFAHASRGQPRHRRRRRP